MRARLAMLAPSMWALSIAADGCSKEPERPAVPAVLAADAAEPSAGPPPPTAPPVDAVASGPSVGQPLPPFDAIDDASGESSCALCRFDGFPKVVAAGTIGDEAFGEDLKNIDAIVAKYGEDRVKAIAVLIEAASDAGAESEPQTALPTRAQAWRRQLDVSIPLVVPAAPGATSSSWHTQYRATRNRTLILADRANLVRYSAVAPTDLAALDAAIRAAVDS